MTLSFSLVAWSAWSPGLASTEQWRQWHQDGSLGEENAPDLSWVPLAQRRRLSSLTRIQLACAQQVLADDSLPVIFATHHGELHRTFQLLTELGQDEPLSPTHFSLSVHNAAAGLLSILRQDQAPANVVVGGDDCLVLGLLEAAALLGSGTDELVLVVGDQAVPEPYLVFQQGQQRDHALALRIKAGNQVTLTSGQGGCAEPWPLAMQLAGLLAAGASGPLQLTDREWQWQQV